MSSTLSIFLSFRNQKTSFNYILFDPRVTGNLQEKAKTLSETEIFRCFIRSIFYVGKGKESRPYEHLHDAMKMKKLNDKAAKVIFNFII